MSFFEQLSAREKGRDGLHRSRIQYAPPVQEAKKRVMLLQKAIDELVPDQPS